MLKTQNETWPEIKGNSSGDQTDTDTNYRNRHRKINLFTFYLFIFELKNLSNGFVVWLFQMFQYKYILSKLSSSFFHLD